ncbi:hypothetical protein SAMN05660206_11640 [Sphingobacterium wenxiniae]|uniref:Uncharacterized protein n=1 Tax=Sphingobacterium wenxiniae TaxID=683125 RepID=A0A1I6VQL0_9SPHI|nr:hypothetical protein SAMN05660206_11640 [Sphingobacterium wenxiniae]
MKYPCLENTTTDEYNLGIPYDHKKTTCEAFMHTI